MKKYIPATVRTRFAPSPTGYLHIGGARTALYAWLYAKAHAGIFVLRIEDTDLERSTQEAVDAILDGLAWLNLPFDEGPFFQTQRLERYQEVLQQLLKQGKAYRCFCSKERLEQLRKEQGDNKQKPRYDRHCRYSTNSPPDQPFVIRFATPETGEVTFVDQVRGPITVQNSELDDLIIARSDGMPTYNFSVVVDDLDMKITHVIRGDDHINNTPRQINIFLALQAPPPLYAHVPMILGADGQRLSKRHGAVSVLQYRDEGYLPDAIMNYLVRLGWSHANQEIFTRDEMIDHFNLNNIGRSPAIFNTDKLLWLNQHYLKTSAPESVAEQLAWQFKKLAIDTASGPSLVDIVLVQRERVKTLAEMAQKSWFFFKEVESYDDEAITKEFTSDAQPILKSLLASFINLSKWSKESIHQVIHNTAVQFNVKMGKVAPLVRIAITGGTVSPSIDLTAQLLGQTTTIRRLEKALMMIKS